MKNGVHSLFRGAGYSRKCSIYNLNTMLHSKYNHNHNYTNTYKITVLYSLSMY
jgi:hypothetical protein